MGIAAREDQRASQTPSLRFHIQSSGLPARVLDLKQDIIKIGKLSSSHIQLQDPAVSRVHAVIEVTAQGEVYVIDLGSSNGTFVNGQKISKERLKTGDELRVGQTVMNVTIEGASDPTSTQRIPKGVAEPAADQPPVAEPPGTEGPEGRAATRPLAPPAAPAPAPAAPAAPAGPDLFAAAAEPAAAPATVPAAPEPVETEPTVVAPAREPARPAAAAPPMAAVPSPEPATPARSAPPPAPEPLGRERRFIAITPAEPVSQLTAKYVEARLAFGRDIIEARTFEAHRPGPLREALQGIFQPKHALRSAFRRAAEVTVGPKPTCDFMVAGFEAPFSLLRAREDGFYLRFRDDMLGRVRLGDRDMDFQELARHPETDPSDKPGEYEWPFQRGAMVSLKVGGTVIYLRSVPKAPPPPVRYLETRDPKLLLSFLGVLLFSGALVWRAVTWPPTPAVLLEDRLKLDEKMVSFLINPEERLRRAKIYGAKLSSDDKEEGGALKGPEGKSGARDAPKVKRRLATAGKEKEYTPAQQRERDLKRVRRLGALAALEKDAELREIFTGGGGGGPGSEFGRGRGGGPDDMTAWGGVGDGPPGESYGLGGFGQGGEGGGGGGIGSYVGIGRLSTRGGYGGRGGSRFGSGVARLREHRTEQPKVVVGEPDVGGGLTREIIRRVIRSHLHEIRYCYERELQKTPDLYGKVVVKFTILPSGNVENSEIFNSTMGNENVEGCMLARVVRWKFPKPYKGASVIVKYPFLFKAAGKD